jgi:hypothetical protein
MVVLSGICEHLVKSTTTFVSRPLRKADRSDPNDFIVLTYLNGSDVNLT